MLNYSITVLWDMENMKETLGLFGGFLHVFLMYSSSKSFRELKSAIKNQFFLYLGGLGAK